MTNRELATALLQATTLEQVARAHWDASPGDGEEQEASRAVLRHTLALKYTLERWISARVVRAQVQTG